MYIDNSPFAPDLPKVRYHQLSTTELLLGLANEISPIMLWKGAEKNRTAQALVFNVYHCSFIKGVTDTPGSIFAWKTLRPYCMQSEGITPSQFIVHRLLQKTSLVRKQQITNIHLINQDLHFQKPIALRQWKVTQWRKSPLDLQYQEEENNALYFWEMRIFRLLGLTACGDGLGTSQAEKLSDAPSKFHCESHSKEITT